MQDLTRFRSERPTLKEFPLDKNVGAWALYAIICAMRIIPMRLSWLLGILLGSLFALVYRTNTIPVNLALCFPNLSAAERRRLRRRYFRRLGQAFLNLGLAWKGSAAQVKRHVTLVGTEHLTGALEQGKGVILLAPHVTGLELGFKRLSLEWRTICMYRKPSDPMKHQLCRYLRTSHGGMCLERYESLKPLVGLIKQGTLFYYLPDQDPDHCGKDYVFAPFFEHPAATFTAMSRLARMSNAVVVPLFVYQRPYGGGYEVRLMPPLEQYPSGDDLADATALNQAIVDGIESMPDQYFWSYRRFKTQPEGAGSPYQAGEGAPVAW